jgi:hypothetical protein
MLNQAPRDKACGGGGMVPLILNLERDGLSGLLHFPITLSLGNDPPLPVEFEYWWASESVWAFWKT